MQAESIIYFSDLLSLSFTTRKDDIMISFLWLGDLLVKIISATCIFYLLAGWEEHLFIPFIVEKFFLIDPAQILNATFSIIDLTFTVCGLPSRFYIYIKSIHKLLPAFTRINRFLHTNQLKIAFPYFLQVDLILHNRYLKIRSQEIWFE